MSKNNPAVSKRERERMKVEKAMMKRERRDHRKSERSKADTEQGVEGTPTFPEGASDPEGVDRRGQG